MRLGVLSLEIKHLIALEDPALANNATAHSISLYCKYKVYI